MQEVPVPTAQALSLIEMLTSPQVVPTLSLYVAGDWTEAADGRTFDSYEPATGRTWAKIAEAGLEDVDRAVRAARGALDGSWGRMLAPDRARVLWRMAELLDANKEPLARIESRDNGKAIRETRAEIANVIRYFEYFAGMCQERPRADDAGDRAVLHVHPPRARRRRRGDHPVELAARHAGVEGLPRARGR
jgi:acyl-CoA reductase-like NAD-dependent aldehyde dehydrogenase